MARVALKQGRAYSGLEQKVEALAWKAAERYIEADDTAGAAAAAGRIRHQFYGNKTTPGYRNVRDAVMKSDLHSFYERPIDHSRPQTFSLSGPLAEAVRSGKVAADARYDYLINQSLGIGRVPKSARASMLAFGAKQEADAKNRIAGANKWDSGSGYSAQSSAQTFIDSDFLQEKELENRRFRSANAQTRRIAERNAKLAPRSRNSENKIVQTNITRGIQTAFGGRSMTFLRQLFGYGFGWGHIARSLTRFVVGNSLNASRSTYSTGLSAIATGTSFKNLYGFGGATKIFGGTEKDAASLFAAVNALRIGALMGHGEGPLGNLRKYGVNVNSFMSPEVIINSIAERYASIGKERGPGWQAMMASEAGLSPAIQKSMMEHPHDYYQWMKSQGPQLTEEKRADLERQAKEMNALNVAFSEMITEWSLKLTPAIENITKLIKGATKLGAETTPVPVKGTFGMPFSIFPLLVPKEEQRKAPDNSPKKKLQEADVGFPMASYGSPQISNGGSVYNLIVNPTIDSEELKSRLVAVIRDYDSNAAVDIFRSSIRYAQRVA